MTHRFLTKLSAAIYTAILLAFSLIAYHRDHDWRWGLALGALAMILIRLHFDNSDD